MVCATIASTSAGLAKLVAASCPASLPGTPLERLDAANARLNTLLYAVATLRAPLDAISTSLNADPRTRVGLQR